MTGVSMKTRYLRLLLALFACFLLGCSDDNNGPSGDGDAGPSEEPDTGIHAGMDAGIDADMADGTGEDASTEVASPPRKIDGYAH
jgi:hypothetical protein